MVQQAHGDAKQHVYNTKNDGNLHFVGIQEDDLIFCQLPSGIYSDWIRIADVFSSTGRVQHESVGYCVDLSGGHVYFPIGSEDVQRLRKYVVVNETSVHGKQPHQENDVAPTEEDVPNLQKI